MMISCIFQSSTLGCTNQAPALWDAQRCPEEVGGSQLAKRGGELTEGENHKHKFFKKWECWALAG